MPCQEFWLVLILDFGYTAASRDGCSYDLIDEIMETPLDFTDELDRPDFLFFFLSSLYMYCSGWAASQDAVQRPIDPIKK